MKRPPAWQRERDRILRDAGFVDIEEPDGTIRQTEDRAFGRRGAREIETTAEYYRAAGKLLHEHDSWKSPVERRIWELHAEGASYTRIWRTVKREIGTGTLPPEKMYRRRVHATVNRLRDIMMGTTAEKQRPGRKRDSDSLRSQGVRLGLVLLSPPAVLALDHVRTQLKVSKAEAVRRALLLFQRAIS